MVRALIIAHGNLAQELLNVAFSITGEKENVFAISNADLNLGSLQEIIREKLCGSDEKVIFVDCLGSTYTAAKIARNKVPIITGVNLPMVISFLTKRDTISLDKLVEILIGDGHKSIIKR
jgi:PTS system mannose-specific IIA component